METSYSFGFKPGTGANKEDLGGKRMRQSPMTRVKGREKVKKTMEEFKAGELHSGSKHGPKVTSRAQALAIGLSEQRKKEGKK